MPQGNFSPVKEVEEQRKKGMSMRDPVFLPELARAKIKGSRMLIPFFLCSSTSFTGAKIPLGGLFCFF